MGGQLGKVVDRLGTTGRILMIGIALATIAVVVYLVTSAGPAAYVPAFTNLDPKTAGEIQSTLAGAGIPSKLGTGGATVSVPSAQVDEARVAVAQSDVAVGGAEGWSLFDKNDMSATDTETQVKFQRAMAGELQTTIESIAGVHSAIVNLALPRDTVFTDDQRQPTASVLVDTGTGTLSDESIRGIVRLVAAGVPGLTPENVTITNEQGQLLSSTSAGVGDGAADRLATEASWNRRMTSRAQAELDLLLGPGKATVVVNGELNMDKTSKTSQTFGKDAGDLQAQSETEKLKSENSPASGAAGTSSNTPTAGAVAPDGSASSAYDHKKSASTSAIDTTQTQQTIAPGDPEKISVSLVVSQDALNNVVDGAYDTKSKQVDATKSDAALSTLSDVVKRSVGWEQSRDGTDSFKAAVAAKFDDPVKSLAKTGAVLTGGSATVAGAGGGGPIGMVFKYLKPVGAAIGFLIFLFMVRRSLKRRQALLGSTDPSWLPALEAPPISIEELMPGNRGPSEAELAAMHKKQLQGRVEELAQQKPQEVAMALRGWLAAES